MDELQHSSVVINDTLQQSPARTNKNNVLGSSFRTRGRSWWNFLIVSWWPGVWEAAVGVYDHRLHLMPTTSGGVEGRGSRAETGLWLCDVNRQEATEGIAGSVRLLLLCLCVFVCALVDQQHGHNTSGGVKLVCINTHSDSFVFVSTPLLHIDGKRRRPIAFPARLHKGQKVLKKQTNIKNTVSMTLRFQV